MLAQRLLRLIAIATIAVTGLVLPRVAAACGGFFCSQSDPVEQTGENILFIQVDESTIETHVQISYAGPAEDFSWIVPTPSEPEVSVGSDFVFQALATQLPQRVDVDFVTEGECMEREWDSTGGWDVGLDVSADTAMADAGSAPPSVDILQQDQAGPFDFVVLRADAVEPMVEWLRENEYDVPDGTVPLLEPYVMGDMYFVGLKLIKDRDAGDLQPIVLRYNAEAPMIPIQLTAVAATPNLRIDAWILSDAPASPENYRLAEENPFLEFSQRVEAVGPAIVDEAGGHAFVRPYTGPSSYVRVLPDWFLTAEDLQGLGYWAFFDRLAASSSELRTDQSFLGVLRECFPVPEEAIALGATERDFWNCMECYEAWIDVDAFDSEACTALMVERVIEPRTHLQGLLDDIPQLTHMITWLDPEEMTVDPGFCYDPAVDDRVTRRMTYTTHCHPTVYADEAPNSLRVGPLSLFADSGSIASAIQDLPVLYRATEGGCGTIEVVVDNKPAFDDALTASVEWFDEHMDDLDGAEPPGRSWGCASAATPNAPSTALAVLALFGLLAPTRCRS